MESGRIANEQISASSTYSDERWTPQQSRLHGDDNGWTPNLDSSKEYLQVCTQIPHGVPRVGGLVGAGGGSAGADGGHKENTHSPSSTAPFIHPSRHMHVPGTERLSQALRSLLGSKDDKADPATTLVKITRLWGSCLAWALFASSNSYPRNIL